MNEEIDLSKEYETDEFCQVSAYYICTQHPSIKKFVKKDDRFPKCEHIAGHDARWWRVK